MESNDLEFDIDEELKNEILYSEIENKINIEQETLNNSNKKRRRKKESKLKIGLRKDIEIKTILLLILFLVANTYAWFKYASIASAEIRMHIKDWNFELTTDTEDESLIIVADQIYPGMEEVKDSITAKNNGEMKAVVYLQYQSVKVLDKTYNVGDIYHDEDTNTDIPISFDYLKDNILAQYPFKVDMYADGVLINQDDKLLMDTLTEKEISVAINWAYEDGTTTDEKAERDLIDTQLGTDAYEYHKNNPTEYSVKIVLKVIAEQYDGSSEDTTP